MDTSSDRYKARLWTDNSILITVPAWPYSLHRNRDALAKNIQKNPSCMNHIVDSLDNALHQNQDNFGQEVSKSILLKFGSSVKLSTKVLVDTGDELSLQPQSFFEETGQNLVLGQSRKYWCVFSVARLDILPSKKGRVQASTSMSVLQQQLGLIGLASPTPALSFASPTLPPRPNGDESTASEPGRYLHIFFCFAVRVQSCFIGTSWCAEHTGTTAVYIFFELAGDFCNFGHTGRAANSPIS